MAQERSWIGEGKLAGLSLSRRAIALIVAVVLAAVATVALVSYVQSAHSNRLPHPVTAFFAKQLIPAGTDAATIISKGLIGTKTIDKADVPDGAISSLTDIQGKTAEVDIQQNEIIIASRFVQPGQGTGTGTTGPELLGLQAGFQAVSVEVSTIPGVANFIQPGDTVSLIVQLTQTTARGQQATVKYLLQNLKVLQVGTRVITPAQNGQPAGASVQSTAGKVDLTLAVTPNQAEKLVYATLNGQLYFGLVHPGDKPVGTPGRTSANEFAR